MNEIVFEQNEPALNGFLGDLIQKVVNPGAADQSEQLMNELYYKDQEIKKLKSQNTLTMAAAGIAGVAALYFGLKHYKKI